MLLIVFVHEDGWAGFFLFALFADDADQVGTSEFQVVLLTQLVQFLEVGADYDCLLCRVVDEIDRFLDIAAVCRLL